MKTDSYDLFSKILHWSMAFIIIYVSIAGYVMHLLIEASALHSFLSVLNMSLATLATPLLVVRYIWKFFRSTPDMPRSISSIQMSIAKLVHSIIYLLMFIVFLSGYLMLTQSYSFFWIVDVDNVINNSDINQFFFTVHRIACLTLFLAVVLHVFAVLKHQFIAKNNVLQVMV